MGNLKGIRYLQIKEKGTNKVASNKLKPDTAKRAFNPCSLPYHLASKSKKTTLIKQNKLRINTKNDHFPINCIILNLLKKRKEQLAT